MTSTTLNGNAYSTDGSAARDMQGSDGYGYQTWLIPMFNDALIEMATRTAAVGSSLVATSSTNSVSIGTGTKTLTVASPSTKGFSAGMYVVAVDAGNSANAMTGRVTSFDTGTGALVLSVPTGGTTGSGTPSSWVIGISGAVGPQGATGVTSAYWGGTAGGTANALTATTGASLSSLTAGQIIGVKVGASANSGAATLAVDSTGAIAIRKNGSALTGAELVASTDLWFQYDGTYWRLLGGAGGEDTATSIAAASTVNLGASSAKAVTITAGTGPITAWGTAAAGAHRDITFSTTVTLTYNATSAILTGGVSITALPGDACRMESLGSGNWKMLSYQRASGRALNGATAQALSSSDKASGITISNGALTAANAAGGVLSGRAALSLSYPVYWEVLVDVLNGTIAVGVASSTVSLTDYISNSASGYAYIPGGQKANNGSAATFGSSWGAGARLCFAYDWNTGKLWAGLVSGGVAVWGGSGDPATGANPAFTIAGIMYPAYSLQTAGSQVTFAFGSGQQVATPPAGFTAFG